MKIKNTLKGLYLLLTSTKIFKPQDIFSGKRVAVIGAADSAFEREMGGLIDDYDIIVRVNKAPHSWTPKKAKFIGSRTDVLFHSFFENNESGGGPIDFKLYERQGIKYVVNPNLNKMGLVAHLNYFKRNGIKRTTYLLSRSFYNEINEGFGKVIPTVGFYALSTLLKSECKEIYISGFTFFKTPYANDYRNHLLDMNENQKHLKQQGMHDPELEFQLFRKQLNKIKKSSTLIILDATLDKVINTQ